MEILRFAQNDNLGNVILSEAKNLSRFISNRRPSRTCEPTISVIHYSGTRWVWV